MSNRIWLASYPKSGNTWLRMLISCLSWPRDKAFDINAAALRGGLASARAPFDDLLLIDSGLLTLDEVDCLRPRLYEELMRPGIFEDAEDDDRIAGQPVSFVKVHDAYTLTPLGEPLLAGAGGAQGAILIVRDPRDVASSLAHHSASTIDAAIDFMNDAAAGFNRSDMRQRKQFRQLLPGWSGHLASWLDQRDIPVHLLRYEDMKRDTAGTLVGAMAFAGWTVTREAADRAVALAAFADLQAQERATGFTEWVDSAASGRLFFRRGEAGAWTRELTQRQVARIEAAHGPAMARLGYTLSTDSRPSCQDRSS
ncbi:MAG TPA: sulfotransferase domain-containing protein [Rhizomicrobium sp.]